MAVVLTSRQVRTAEWLLQQSKPRSISDAAVELRLSPRVVRSGLDGIGRYLEPFGVTLERRRGLGVWVEASPAAVAAARVSISGLADEDSVMVFSAADRLHRTLFELLTAAPEPQTVEHIREVLHVSVTSARRDIARAEPWLTARGLFLARQPGYGLTVIGTETAIRRALVKLFLETVPHDLLASDTVGDDWHRTPNIGGGIRQALQALPISQCHTIVRNNGALQALAEAGHPWLAAHLAVTAFRISADRHLTLEAGSLRSLSDHPVWQTAETVAAEIAELVGHALDPSEVGGIAEQLLGMAELIDIADSAPSSDAAVREAITVAAEHLHPGLADDVELARSLAQHFDRLRVRLRYGLPVHNPLLGDVSDRYPGVHEVAISISESVGRSFGVRISADEAGYITMYLSGALERLRLRPRKRAIVVCPSGVATAWILVSRIQAEFPELDLVDVVSAGSIPDHEDLEADLVISTVEIAADAVGVPVMVVNPLLPSDDVKRLFRIV